MNKLKLKKWIDNNCVVEYVNFNVFYKNNEYKRLSSYMIRGIDFFKKYIKNSNTKFYILKNKSGEIIYNSGGEMFIQMYIEEINRRFYLKLKK